MSRVVTGKMSSWNWTWNGDGDGRIPLQVFYGQQDNAKYQFSESVQYLQEIGALDESGEKKGADRELPAGPLQLHCVVVLLLHLLPQ